MTTRRVFLTAVIVAPMLPSVAAAQRAYITFRNTAAFQIEIFWMNPATGVETAYAVVTPGASYSANTSVGDVWRFRQRGGPPIASDWTVGTMSGTLEIGAGGWTFRPN